MLRRAEGNFVGLSLRSTSFTLEIVIPTIVNIKILIIAALNYLHI